MELGPFVKGALQVPKNILSRPLDTAERVGSYGLSIFTQSLELFAPTQTQEEFVETLKKQKPIAEADCAKRALRASERARKKALKVAAAEPIVGKETVQEEIVEILEEAEVLGAIGYTMLKKNIIRAEISEEVPDHTTQHLVFEALEVGVDPQKKGFLRDEEVEVTSEVFSKHDNVTVFPTEK